MTKATQKSGLKERLAQAAIEGIAMEVAINTLLPGSGLALSNIRSAKGFKKVAEVAGKSAAKEGIKSLDDENGTQDKTEELAGDLTIELLSRSRGR
ncbi:MAG: hypothetical protein ACI4OR_02180 [Alphaproteobacteria bacterium]